VSHCPSIARATGLVSRQPAQDIVKLCDGVLSGEPVRVPSRILAAASAWRAWLCQNQTE
jgi:hypothetical protein